MIHFANLPVLPFFLQKQLTAFILRQKTSLFYVAMAWLFSGIDSPFDLKAVI
jgi:hypothetical protein